MRKKINTIIIMALTFILAISALPISAYAEQSVGNSTQNSITIDGIKYSISKKEDSIQVSTYKNDKLQDRCISYPSQGYMIYKVYDSPDKGSAASTVTWLEDVIADEVSSNPLLNITTNAYSTWTKDGKYVYNPTLISVMPNKYKNHTAYYWFRNIGTENTTRKLNIEKGTAVTQVVTLLVGILGTVATCGMSTVAALCVSGIITTAGGAVTEGIVSRTISPTVNVEAINYQAKFLDSSEEGTGTIFRGSKIIVKETKSNHFNEVYYEDYSPQRSQKFALTAYLNTFKGNYIKYPGLDYYVEL